MLSNHRTKTVMFLSIILILIGAGGAFAALSSKAKAKKALVSEAETKKIEQEKTIQQEPQINVENQVQSGTESQIDAQQEKQEKVTVQAAEIESVNNNPIHRNISTTYFWAGEEAGKDNKNISNLPSAWDEQWVKHFGGVDNPNKRSGYVVASFTPKENSFYFALPYNDFDENGNRKKDVGKVIPWASSKKWGANESMCKNQWMKITKGGKTAYAQWQDVGPFGEDDSAYVFGGKAPKSKTNETAGLDVSPAVKDFLGLGDIDRTDWQFVSVSQVPEGPWKKTITNSQIYWN